MFVNIRANGWRFDCDLALHIRSEGSFQTQTLFRDDFGFPEIHILSPGLQKLLSKNQFSHMQYGFNVTGDGKIQLCIHLIVLVVLVFMKEILFCQKLFLYKVAYIDQISTVNKPLCLIRVQKDTINHKIIQKLDETTVFFCFVLFF